MLPGKELTSYESWIGKELLLAQCCTAGLVACVERLRSRSLVEVELREIKELAGLTKSNRGLGGLVRRRVARSVKGNARA
jgi:hypothetical protein